MPVPEGKLLDVITRKISIVKIYSGQKDLMEEIYSRCYMLPFAIYDRSKNILYLDNKGSPDGIVDREIDLNKEDGNLEIKIPPCK